MILSQARRRSVTCGGNYAGNKILPWDRCSRIAGRASDEWPKRRPMPEEAPPRICISYCHDSPGHQDRVPADADRPRGEVVSGAGKGPRPVRRPRIGPRAAAGAIAGMSLAGPAVADPSAADSIHGSGGLAKDEREAARLCRPAHLRTSSGRPPAHHTVSGANGNRPRVLTPP